MDASIMADMENEAARSSQKGRAKKGKSKKWLGLVCVLALGGAAYYGYEHTEFFKQPRIDDIPSASLFLNAEHTKNAEPAIADPVFYSMDPFVVNLADPDADKYLQVTLVYNVVSEDTQKALEKIEPMLRSRILMALGSKKLEQVKSLQAKQALMDEMLEIARVTMARSNDPSKGIRDVHFSTYIVQ